MKNQKIVILDGYTLNPGDLDWKAMQDLGELHVYDRTAEDQIIKRASGASILFTNKTVLRQATLDQLPGLQYIGVLATGYDVVDTEAARKRGITVTNVPSYGADSVAQMVFAHILHIVNNVAAHSNDIKKGGWCKQEDFCYLLSPQVELADKVMGIIGFGEIGRATARLAAAFKMKILVHTRTAPSSLPGNIQHVSLEKLLASSDIISLHCPLTIQTRSIINAERIELMKKGVILVNCSRGPLVDEEALVSAINSGKIGAAGLDVLSEEPARQDNPLLKIQKCNITPHIAWATREARTRLLNIAVENLRSFLRGDTKNRIV